MSEHRLTLSAKSYLASARANRVGLILSIMLVAVNLRIIFSSLSILLPEIKRDTGLTPAALGALTTLPVLCLGLFAPLAPRLAQRFGVERVLFTVLLLLTLGTGLRGTETISSLYLGTALAGIAIAIGNVLLPGLVKRDFPNQLPVITGLYSMALCGGAALAAAGTLPLQQALHGSWHWALSIWAIPALIAAFIWLFRLRAADTRLTIAQYRVVGLWQDPLAWQLTLFMGLQSALAYCVFGWLAPILRARDISGTEAGLIVSLSVMMQVLASVIVPLLAGISKDQRLINVILASLAVLGLIGMMFGPIASIWLWAGLQGIGQGGLFAVAMTMIVLRSPDAKVAAQLSGMAQGVGYVLASFGPLLMGWLLGRSETFHAPAALVMTLGLGVAICGLGAGRALLVKAEAKDLSE